MKVHEVVTGSRQGIADGLFTTLIIKHFKIEWWVWPMSFFYSCLELTCKSHTMLSIEFQVLGQGRFQGFRPERPELRVPPEVTSRAEDGDTSVKVSRYLISPSSRTTNPPARQQVKRPLENLIITRTYLDSPFVSISYRF
jgi:hypothetical protein